MRNVGKVTVQLLDGSGYGPRLVEIGNWVGKGYFVPRRDLAQVLERDDCDKPGVYFLKYLDPENGREMVYIGEADCLRDRLRTHLRDRQKNHFIEVMFFISKDDWLTKTQVKYLEHRLVKHANTVGAAKLNKNEPSEPRIQAGEKPDLEDFLERIMLLLPIMGFRFMLEEFIPVVDEFALPDLESLDLVEEENFEAPPVKIIDRPTRPKVKHAAEELSSSPRDGGRGFVAQEPPAKLEIEEPVLQPKAPASEELVGEYRIVDKNLRATMDKVDGYFVVRKGSQARKSVSNSIDKIYLALRTALLEEGILIDDGEYYVFSEDYRFTSASAASNVVLGRQSPGPRMWVDAENRSLRGIVNDPIG